MTDQGSDQGQPPDEIRPQLVVPANLKMPMVHGITYSATLQGDMVIYFFQDVATPKSTVARLKPDGDVVNSFEMTIARRNRGRRDG